jgi:spore germination protein YaaH
MKSRVRNTMPVAAAGLAGALLLWLAMVVTVEPMPGGPGRHSDTPMPSAGPAGPAMLVGYVPYWDQNRGFASVTSNVRMFDEVSPFWYAPDRNGDVVRADPDHTKIDTGTVRMLRERGVRVLPTVTNIGDDIPPDVVSELLHDPAATRRHVRALLELAVSGGYDGIDLDYESLRAGDRDVYSAFVRELARALHGGGKLLSVAVHPKLSDAGYDERNQAQDFRAIGAVADEVRVMAYDYHWADSPPGAVAPAGWVDEVIAWTVTQIPAAKVVLGAVLLGYDWVGRTGSTVDDRTALRLAAEHHAMVRRADDQSPWFRYADADGHQHTVWWEDARSLTGKLAVAAKYRLGGVFLWRLGGEDRAVWAELRAWLGRPPK